ncbi:MAG: UDP-N-acetylglucosamine 1-carboxyvinyltransferase [Turicibacter sp.]|nr:UDP-N-acetylglucosamine 1-carboxyvinyltransferase [Turicibacter sp.]
MEVIKIEGGHPLRGTVRIDSAKNSTVALIPAAILADSTVVLEGIPNIVDVKHLGTMIEQLNGTYSLEGEDFIIDPSQLKNTPLVEGAVTKLRASYYFMGALLGKFKEAVIGMPGGCYLGPRPIDLHLKGFEALGATIKQEAGAIYLKAERLVGASIYLDFPSVGATINIMLAAVRAEGLTIIENAAKEPEIIDLANLLNSMGAKIKGGGTDEIRITGVDQLKGTRHAIIPDRIEAGTYIALAAAAGDEVKIDNIIPHHLEALILKLREMGVDIDVFADHVIVRGRQNMRAVDFKTSIYPGLATDLQQPLVTLLTQATGFGMVTDNIYSDRFKNCYELNKMGADIKVNGNAAMLNGPYSLMGTRVKATDLRAGASLVIAALIADGVTEISNVYHIDRGYSNIEEKLTNLGAKIWREEVEE